MPFSKSRRCGPILPLLFAATVGLFFIRPSQAEAQAKESAMSLIGDHAASLLVVDFYQSKDVRNTMMTSLLARASAADTVPLKKALASIERDKKAIQLFAEDGALRVVNSRGQVIAEISRHETSTPEDAGFILNSRPFSKPPNGSLVDAIRLHLLRNSDKSSDATRKSALHRSQIFLPTAEASQATTRVAAEAEQATLPIYLYIDFHDANQTPPQSHDVSQEVKNQANTIKAQIMPESSNAFFSTAKRLVFDEKGSLACEGSGTMITAKGIARIDGELLRFESRADGDVILTPAFRDGPPARLRPSRIDFDATSKQLDQLLTEFQKTKSPDIAQGIVDGPVRTICERITMLKVDSQVASLCERAYENKVSIEGRCLQAERGPDRVECERSRGVSLSQNAFALAQEQAVKFVGSESHRLQAMARSVANVKVIGRRLSIGQCRDGMTCESTGETNAVEMVRPAPSTPSSKVASVLAKRHPSTGGQPLVKYGCSVQNETCSLLIETEAARQLPAKDQARLRAEIRNANFSIYWRKDAFLAEASALRPLGQCCAEAPCRERLTKDLGLSLKSNGAESKKTKGTTK